jgi:GT2 family glycosyltransferase
MRNSVIASSFEEQSQEQVFLKALKSTLSINDEVIIAVSDNSQINNSKDQVKFIYNPLTISPVGFNLCLNEASGDYITLTGIRSFISANYVNKAIEILNANQEIGCAGGRIIHKANTEYGMAIAKAMGAPFGMGIFSFRSLQKSGYTDTVSVPVFKRDVIEKVGLFDETLIRNQDDDYSYRLKKAGYKIWHEASITSTYFVREKFSQLAEQFFQYGFWKNYVNKKHKTITTLRQLVPPLFLITQLLLLFLNPVILFVLLLLYSVLLFTQSVSINQLKLRPALKTLYAFIVMHYCYGLGYIYGFIYAFIFNISAPEFVKKITR